MTAFARNPGKLETRSGLTIVAGAIDDPLAVRQAVSGADAVISLLGPGPDRGGVAALVPGMRTIVRAMEEAGVRRLVATATPSAPDQEDQRDLRVRLLVKMIRFSMPYAYNAIRGIDEAIRSSSLDWTIVRLPFLHDRPTTDPAQPRRVGEPGGLGLSRPNLVAFLLQAVEDPALVGRAPLLADS